MAGLMTDTQSSAGQRRVALVTGTAHGIDAAVMERDDEYALF